MMRSLKKFLKNSAKSVTTNALALTHASRTKSLRKSVVPVVFFCFRCIHVISDQSQIGTRDPMTFATRSTSQRRWVFCSRAILVSRRVRISRKAAATKKKAPAKPSRGLAKCDLAEDGRSDRQIPFWPVLLSEESQLPLLTSGVRQANAHKFGYLRTVLQVLHW